MKFGQVEIMNSVGCLLAHSLHIHGRKIAKGTRITPEIAEQLAESGIRQVLAAQLGTCDVHENEAALRIASQLAGDGISLSAARTGRVNLLANIEGLCCFSAQTIAQANAIDEGITIATLRENRWIAKGRMVATVKIIPYAVNEATLQLVLDGMREHRLTVAAALPHTAELIQTRLGTTRESLLDKTRRVTEDRLLPRAVTLAHESRCKHDTDDLSHCIQASLQRKPDWLLIVGASAISDRADVIPQAIIAAGGRIERYGIPVDPGNLLLLAQLGQTKVIGLPGCARSPRYNGLDMIIDRMACEVPVSNQWLSSLSVGGLLEEIADRPAPRTGVSGQRQIGAVILAAGSSRRAGSTNKLLAQYGDVPMVAHIAKAVSDSDVCRVVAVTGHESELVMEALADGNVECHYNAAHQSGMASSVVMGISQMNDTDGVLVCLGDMPHVTTDVINRLIDAFRNNGEKSIIVPVTGRRRGNPVLFGKVFFDTLLALKGDVGARKLVSQYPDAVLEVEVDNDGVLRDYDTPEELAELNSSPT